MNYKELRALINNIKPLMDEGCKIVVDNGRDGFEEYYEAEISPVKLGTGEIVLLVRSK